jgi:flagellar basal body-associated protein FliL
MADQELDNRPQGDQATKAQGKKTKPLLVMILTIVLCAAAGFLIGRIFGTRGKTQTVSAAEEVNPLGDALKPELDAPDVEQGWYYFLEPVVANLNEPGVTRYVRVALTLEMSNRLKQSEATALLDQQKPVMMHWLRLYLSNETLEDFRGEKNLRRMETELSDYFNQRLFPDAKPLVKRVLFKELSIQ